MVAAGTAAARRAVRLRLYAQALSAEKDAALALVLRKSAVQTQFLGNVSHELRTRRIGILGVARLLPHLPGPEVGRRIELIESRHAPVRLGNDLIGRVAPEAGSFAPGSECSTSRFWSRRWGRLPRVAAGTSGASKFDWI